MNFGNCWTGIWGNGATPPPAEVGLLRCFFFVFVLWLLGAGRKQVFAEHWGILGNYSSNSVAILKGSDGVSVKARCSIELVPVGSGVFLENFYKNWFS